MDPILTTFNHNGIAMNLYKKDSSLDSLILECCGECIKGIKNILPHLSEIAWGSAAAKAMLETIEDRWPVVTLMK